MLLMLDKIKGRLTAVILPPVDDPENGNVSTCPRYEYKYDDYGNQIAIWDNIKQYDDATPTDYDHKRITLFTYNELHQQVSRTLPGGAPTETNEYDARGRLRLHVDCKGQGTGYFYNDLGQLWYKNSYINSSSYNAGDPEVGWDEQIEYAYDDLGRTETEVDARGTTIYYYDAEGNVEQIDSPEGTVNYEYSPVTSRKVRTWTDQTETRFAYDELGRLKETKLVKRDGVDLTIAPNTPEVTTYDYDAVGNRLHQWIDQNNDQTIDLTATYDYDNLNRLKGLVHTNAANQQLASYGYTPAADGMRTNVTDQMRKVGATSQIDNDTFDKVYGYDNLNRLTSESSFEHDTNNGYNATYTYDLVGNRKRREIISHQEGENQGLGTVHTTEYVYDTNGRDRLDSESYSVAPQQLQGRLDLRQYYPVQYATNAPAGSGSPQYQIGWWAVPSRLWQSGYIGFLLVLPLLLLFPALWAEVKRIAGLQPAPAYARPRLSGLNRGIIYFLTLVFILSPSSLQIWADQSQLYSSLKDRAEKIWGENNRTIHYHYDNNGSMTAKITAVTGEEDPDNNFIEKVEYG